MDDSDFNFLKKHCIAFGDHIPPPVSSINQVPGYSTKFLNILKEKKLNVPTPIQAYLWPIIFRGRSATCVAAHKSGKTLSYLIPALSGTHFKDEDSVKITYGDEGPRIIVICSGTSRINEIRDRSFNILDGAKFPRVVTITRDNEKSISLNLLNGCEVLVSTPAPLQRLIDSGLVRFDVCSFLVFDDADKSFTIQSEFIQSIVLAYLNSYNKRLNLASDLNTLLTAPILVLADSWTKEVRNFANQYMRNSINIFGDMFEAAIAHNLEYKVHFVVAEEKRIDFLSDVIFTMIRRGRLERIAIVCSNDDEAAMVLKAMTDLDVNPAAFDSSKFNYDMPKLVDLCKTHPRAITIITDDKIKEVPQINFIETLVHYSMPNHSDIFKSRFLLMSDLIKRGEALNTHFLLSSANGNHAHFLVQTLQRISEVPASLENLKNISFRPLCDYYLAFAFCPFKPSFCINRHQFKASEAIDKDLPMDGQIRFEISHIITVNQFYIRLIEFRDSFNENGSWNKFNYQYKAIKDDLQALKYELPNAEKMPVTGKIYALVVVDAVYRVKIIENLGQLNAKETNMPINEDTPYQLEVYFVDFGYQSKALSNQLIALPKNLRKYPPLAFKTYLLGIKPKDNEVEWTHQPTEKLTSFLKDNKTVQATAWIRLQRKSIFWLDNMKIMQSLKHFTCNVIGWNAQCDLIDYNLADKNENLFPQVNTNHQELYFKWFNHRLLKFINRAFLSDDFEMVYISHFKKLDDFYVQRKTDFSCLEGLEKDLAKSDLKPLKYFAQGFLGIGVLETSTSKSYSRMRVQNYYPDKQEVEVFFVDWGETFKIPETNCYAIDEKYVKKLPFQAIKCSLAGVNGTIDANVIYDLTRFDDESLKDCLVEKINGDKENGYIVRIWFEKEVMDNKIVFHLLSKWLVEHGYVECQCPAEMSQNSTKIMDYKKNVADEYESDDEDGVAAGEKQCFKNLLSQVNEGMRQYLIENDEKDRVQFDFKKISRQKRLMLTLKRIKEQKEIENLEDDDSDDDDFNWQKVKSDKPVPYREIDYSNVLPYDPTSSESGSECESDLEEFDEELS